MRTATRLNVWYAAAVWIHAAYWAASTLSSPSLARGLRADDGSLWVAPWDTPAQAYAQRGLVADRDDGADPQLIDEPGTRTVMRCLGTTIVTRACHFEDVYYELESKRFVYFGPPGASPELFGRSPVAEDDEPWLRLIRCDSYDYCLRGASSRCLAVLSQDS